MQSCCRRAAAPSGEQLRRFDGECCVRVGSACYKRCAVCTWLCRVRDRVRCARNAPRGSMCRSHDDVSCGAGCAMWLRGEKSPSPKPDALLEADVASVRIPFKGRSPGAKIVPCVDAECDSPETPCWSTDALVVIFLFTNEAASGVGDA